MLLFAAESELGMGLQAERVLLLAEQNELPRLPSREQEVLHYQWFADMGYVDAQRVVGRLLSQAGEQSAEKGLRYVRCHLPARPLLAAALALKAESHLNVKFASQKYVWLTTPLLLHLPDR